MISSEVLVIIELDLLQLRQGDSTVEVVILQIMPYHSRNPWLLYYNKRRLNVSNYRYTICTQKKIKACLKLAKEVKFFIKTIKPLNYD